MADFIRRRVQAAGGGASGQPAPPGSWAKRLPALSEFLCVTEWEPGQPRVTGSLSIFTDGGVWKCCLSNRDSGEVAFLSAKDPDELLLAVEKALRADSLDWRQGREWRARKK